ncbi:hypothetical protein [Leclercia sp.]|uniref:hypothetical protein n=1 Tax=Leclercia sp. TaxID=1898428 RepID=UPI002FDD56EF
MVRPSKIGFDVDDFVEKDKFSIIPLARRKAIEHDVQQAYMARVNAVKARVDTLTPHQREQFHQTLATLLAQTAFTRSSDERK